MPDPNELAHSAAIMLYLAQPHVTEAMVVLLESNPAAADPKVAQQDVQNTLDEMSAAYAARHQLLLDRIAANRADGAGHRGCQASKH